MCALFDEDVKLHVVRKVAENFNSVKRKLSCKFERNIRIISDLIVNPINVANEQCGTVGLNLLMANVNGNVSANNEKGFYSMRTQGTCASVGFNM